MSELQMTSTHSQSDTGSMTLTRRLVIAIGLAGLFLSTFPFITGPMQIATTAYFLMLNGILFRKVSLRAHIALMLSAINLDLALVLALQVRRDAVQTALAFSLGGFQQAHIGASLAATLLYLPMIYLGIQKLSNPAQPARIARLHRSLGWTTFVFRTLGYFLMFSMLGRHP